MIKSNTHINLYINKRLDYVCLFDHANLENGWMDFDNFLKI